MKLKYYLRGLGIGIIVTTVILMISFSGRSESLTDDEIIARAKQLGMVMPEEEPPEDAGDDADAAGTGSDPLHADDGADPSQPGESGDDAGADPDLPVDGADAGTPQAGGSGDQPQAGGNAGVPEHVAVGEDATDPTDQNETETYRLTVSRGDVCRVICENLAANGVVNDAEALRQYLLQIGYASHISVGEYDIPYGLTNEEVADILKAGPIEKDE